MESLIQDVRYALAMMRRNRGFTATALLTLALGIGATTAVFSAVYGVLLRPLPFPAPERIVELSEEHPGAVSPLRSPMISNLTYYAWSQAPRTLDLLAAHHPDQWTVGFADGAARVSGEMVTPSLFALLGVTPALGRSFQPADAKKGADAIVVLSDRLWRERFGADPLVVGRGIMLDGQPHTIVGVARPGFSFPNSDTLLWKPYEVPPPDPGAVTGRRGRVAIVFALARLKTGATVQQAEAEGTAAARTTTMPMAANLLFGQGGPVVVHVRTLAEQMTSRIRPALLVLAAAVAMVLLIACANVANLLLARGVARQRELGLRVALGASGARIRRQLLTESVVLSSLGGALGLVLAWALVRTATVWAMSDFPRLDDVHVDGPVLGFALVASMITAAVSGLAPAFRGAQPDVSKSLHGGDGASAGGFRTAGARRLRDGLLAAEAAFAVVLLVGATLLAHSFVRLTQVDSGYTATNVLAAQVYVPGVDRSDPGDRMSSLVAGLLDRIRAIPGVVSAGAGNMMPLDNATMIAGFPVPGQLNASKPAIARALLYLVTPGYAEALGLRLRAGRLFEDADRSVGRRGWIVNEEFARLYLPPNPVGFQFDWREDEKPVPSEIIGIVGNVLKNGNDTRPQPEVYRTARDQQKFDGRFEIAVRTVGSPASVAQPLRAMVRELEPTAALETVPLSDRVAASVEQPRFAMSVLLVFAALALALASVGLYGVLSYTVSQCRRELGIRAALGAERRELMTLVLRQGLTVTLIGVGIGLIGAAALTRFMQSVLFGVSPLDGPAFSAGPLLLIPVAVAACLVPAMRAASIDPAVALRSE